MPHRRDVRVRWVAASLITLAVHGLVFLGLSQTPRGGRDPEPPLIEVTLARLEPPKAQQAEPVETRAAPPMQLHQPPSVAPDAPSSGLTPGPPVEGPIPPGPRSAPVPGPTAEPAPKLKLDCLTLSPNARRGLYGREDCEPQRYAKIGEGEGPGLPSNPAWDAEVANRMRKHEPLRPDPPFKNACANSNLGLGCTDDMLIPLAKKKF